MITTSAYKHLRLLVEGRFLAKGDWFNAIPWPDKRAACEEVGLDYRHAKECGRVAEAFPMSSREDKLGFTHYKTVTYMIPTEETRRSLEKENDRLQIHSLLLVTWRCLQVTGISVC